MLSCVSQHAYNYRRLRYLNTTIYSNFGQYLKHPYIKNSNVSSYMTHHLIFALGFLSTPFSSVLKFSNMSGYWPCKHYGGGVWYLLFVCFCVIIMIIYYFDSCLKSWDTSEVPQQLLFWCEKYFSAKCLYACRSSWCVSIKKTPRRNTTCLYS